MEFQVLKYGYLKENKHKNRTNKQQINKNF